MSLRSPTNHENGGAFLHMALSSTRHSRARGNPGLLRRISLDTRFRGYDGTQAVLRSYPCTGIFEGAHEGDDVRNFLYPRYNCDRHAGMDAGIQFRRTH